VVEAIFMVVAALSSSDATVAWICLIVGLIVLIVGVGMGLFITITVKTPGDANAAIDDAKSKIDEAKSHLNDATSTLRTTEQQGAAGGTGASDVQKSASEAAASADAAKSAMEQVEGIVASLPQNLRFAGLLVLIGTALISVATIQFGGTSLF
jgi:hypothetical protein